MSYYNCTINAECNFDNYNKGLFEECDKEENVGSKWGCYCSLFAQGIVKSCVQPHVFAQSPPGPVINIQATLLIISDWCINISHLALFGSSGNFCIACTQSNMCACSYILTVYSSSPGKSNKKGTAVNTAWQRNLSACHFAHAFARWPRIRLSETQT